MAKKPIPSFSDIDRAARDLSKSERDREMFFFTICRLCWIHPPFARDLLDAVTYALEEHSSFDAFLRKVTDDEEIKNISGLAKRVLAQRHKEDKRFPAPVVLGYRKDGRASLSGFRMSGLQKLIRLLAREQTAA